MSQKPGNKPKKTQLPDPKIQKKGIPQAKKDLLSSMDSYFEKKQKFFLYLGLILAAVFSVLLFDAKVSQGGDDSAYITRAYDFVHSFTYPGYQGALYPLFLSLFVWFAGINLILLKVHSLICILISFYFFYRAFSGKLPQSVLAFTFVILSFNSFILFFASQTYSEAFFMMLQAIFFWYMIRYFTSENQEKVPLKKYFTLGFLLFLLTLTRSIAYASVAVVLLYFFLEKRWKSMLFSLAGFFTFFIPFEILKRIIWGTHGLQFSSQGSGLMYKNFYYPSQGKEDFIGFIHRLIDNSNLYFSKHLFAFIGFREDVTEIHPVLTIIVYLLLGLALYWGFRKNKTLLFTALYTIIMSVATFLAVQKHWDQWRLIIILFPTILLLVFGGIYFYTKQLKIKLWQIVMPGLAIVILITSLGVSFSKAKANQEILSHNLHGDQLYGLTPDWVNYIKMSQWAAKNTPGGYMTGVRKADISFIYGERKFFGITKVLSISSDSLLKSTADSAVYIGMRLERLSATSFFNEPEFRKKVLAVINGNFDFGNDGPNESNIVVIAKFNRSEYPEWEKKIRQSGVYYDPKIRDWVKNIGKTAKDYSIQLPDMLLDYLKQNKVKYLLLASLRMNPSEYTGNIITTLHRYVYFIQLKYPDIFRIVNTIGDQENAQLVEITVI